MLHHRRWAPVVGSDESHRHPWVEGRRIRYCSRVSTCVRWQGNKGRNEGRRQKGERQPGHGIFIDGKHQRADLINTVTPPMNAPPNGLFFLSQTGRYEFCVDTVSQRLPPEKTRPIGKKGDPPRSLPSFVSQGTYLRESREVAG